MKINFVGSTESDALTSTSISTNSVGETPPLTILEIENPLDQHVIIGTNGPDQRESEAITRALDWLAERRSSDYGWNNDTHLVILAKELAGQRDFAESTDAHIQIIQDLEDMLSFKQMSIEILSSIDHHHHAVIPKSYNVADLAQYALALGESHTIDSFIPRENRIKSLEISKIFAKNPNTLKNLNFTRKIVKISIFSGIV